MQSRWIKDCDLTQNIADSFSTFSDRLFRGNDETDNTYVNAFTPSFPLLTIAFRSGTRASRCHEYEIFLSRVIKHIGKEFTHNLPLILWTQRKVCILPYQRGIHMADNRARFNRR